MSKATALVHLVRHGETALNASSCFLGVTDVPLSENGQRQAEGLAFTLASLPLRAVHTSPLTRALETAQSIARWHQLVPVLQPQLAELHHGQLEGLPYTALADRYPEVMAAWLNDPSRVQMPGGESLEELRMRTWAAFQRIVAGAVGEICIVSHKMALSAILCEAIGLPLRHAMRLEVGLCSVSTLELRLGRGWRLLQLNAGPVTRT